MGFGSDLGFALRVIIAPGKNAKKALTVGSALKIYYEASIVPLLFAIFIGVLLLDAGIQNITVPLIGSFAVFGMQAALALAIIISMWVLVPIGLFINAFFYQIIGKRVLNAWNGAYEKTFAASMFGVLPQTMLYWLLAIPILSIIALAIIFVWNFIVLIIGLAVQQKTSRVNAFVAILATVISVMAIAMILIFAATTLYMLPATVPAGSGTLHPI